MTGWADDARFWVAQWYEELGRQESAVESYRSIIKDFSPTVERCKARLISIDPARFKHFKNKKVKGKKNNNTPSVDL